jgi:DNA-directed RNA polymerase subunit M/transcription elongation factor TFIIS
MIFCKCGKLMEVNENNSKNFGSVKVAYCICGEKKIIGEEISFEENRPKKEARSSEVVEKKHDLGGFPHICSKCGYGECEVHELGVFYGDEAGVYLFKCKKCGWSERQSDGTGN